MPSKEEGAANGGPLPGDVKVICDVLDSAVGCAFNGHVFTYTFHIL